MADAKERWELAQEHEAAWWAEYLETELGFTNHSQLAGFRLAEGRYWITRFDFPWHDWRFSREDSFFGGKKLLDLGCAVGSFFELATGLRKVVAIDPLLATLAENIKAVTTRKQGTCTYKSCVIQDIQEEDFDIVWCCNVLDHCAGWRDILAHCARVLNPGGTLLLAVDCRYQGHQGDKFHISPFTAAEVLAALDEAGFEVEWHSEINDEAVQYNFRVRAVKKE